VNRRQLMIGAGLLPIAPLVAKIAEAMPQPIVTPVKQTITHLDDAGVVLSQRRSFRMFVSYRGMGPSNLFEVIEDNYGNRYRVVSLQRQCTVDGGIYTHAELMPIDKASIMDARTAHCPLFDDQLDIAYELEDGRV
jgi:hypothetical protein